jgi:hypothetical protein
VKIDPGDLGLRNEPTRRVWAGSRGEAGESGTTESLNKVMAAARRILDELPPPPILGAAGLDAGRPTGSTGSRRDRRRRLRHAK